MWGFKRWIALRVAVCTAGLSALCAVGPAALAQQQHAKPAAQKQVNQNTGKEPTQADICYGMTGANAPAKIAACTKAIDEEGLTAGALALAYLNRGLAESGPGSEQRSRTDFRNAIKVFTEAITTSPLNAQLYIQRGVVYQTIGEADRAILDYSDAIRLAPRETLPLINRGVVLYTRKDNNEGAIGDFNAALKINSKEISAYINRGIVYRKKGDVDRAIADFTTAIKLLPEKMEPVSVKVVPDAVTSQLAASSAQQAQDRANHYALQGAFVYFQRGLSYYDKTDYDKAITDFTEAIRLNPRDAAGYVGRGAAWMYKENYKQAIADFSEGLRLAPGQAFAHMQRGIAYHRIGDADHALEDYTLAHELTPKDPNPLVNRGIVYYTKKGKFDEAVADFDHALKLNPKEINALVNRGVTWRQKNDPDRAIQDFTEAIRLGLQTADILRLAKKTGTAGPRGASDRRPGGERLLPARHGAHRQAGIRGRGQGLRGGA
jgi:tetratricopeptide (TPR) repeat protein